jgi:quercetin dioxygenase-like cupin family protein
MVSRGCVTPGVVPRIGDEDRMGQSVPTTAEVQRAHADRQIVNPVSGERIVIRTSGAETGGRLLVFDLTLPPGARVPAGHTHPQQVEQFAVLAGRVRFTLGRRTILAETGDIVEVPPGTPHWFGNAGPDTARLSVEVRPALRTEELLRASAAMSVAGSFFGTRVPHLPDLARLLLEFRHELAVPHVPASVVRGLLALLAWIDRRWVGLVTTGPSRHD